MPGETIQAFCKRCNSVISAGVRATASGDPTEDLAEHLDPNEDGFRRVRYKLAFCPKCEAVFLYRSCETEPSEILYEEILYPRASEPLATNIPSVVRRPRESAVSCLATGNYEPCVILCRKALEAVCVALGEDKGNLRRATAPPSRRPQD